MSEVDPTKMKVVELRSELSVRGLDTKGNKAVLVRRLKTALAKEAGAVADENGAELDATGDFDTSYESQEEGKADGQGDAEDEILKDDDDEHEENNEVITEEMENEILEKESEFEVVDSMISTEDTENSSKADDVAEEKSESAPNDVASKNEDKKDDNKVEDKKDEDKKDEDKKDEDKKDEDMKVEDMKVEDKKDEDKKGEDEKDEDKKDVEMEEPKEADKSNEENTDSSKGQKRKRSHSRDDRRDEKVEKHEPPPPLEDLEEFDSNLVVLDLYMSDLNLKLEKDRCSATPIHSNGFAFMWGGAKAVYGVNEGKVCFEVKVTKKEEVKHLPDNEDNPHVVRVGFSTAKSSLQLGEESLSYGYGGTGKFSTDCKFSNYGKAFSEGDVVQCFLNLDEDPMPLSFAVNGEHLGNAIEISKESLNDSSLFPHILTKNCSFEVNFGQKEELYFPLPEGYTDFELIQNIPLEKRIRGPTCPEKKEDCEMIMMCGLPGAGKTYWANDYAKKNPEKMFNILGTNSIIDKMKVMGLPRKNNYHGRWEVLIEKATSCLNKMFDIAFRRRRNYILDQTNVYASAQKRKMRPFEGFQRKAVVVVPTDDEFKSRIAKRSKEEGKDVPDHAVLEMKANFSLPKVGDWFSSVEFSDLQEEEAQKLVDQYRKEGQAAAPRKRFKRDDRRGNRDRRQGRDRTPGARNNNYRSNRPSGQRNWNNNGGSSGGGYRNWSGPDRNMNSGNQSRNWGNRSGGGGGPNSMGQGNRNWGPSGGTPPRRNWNSPNSRDFGRDNFRGNRNNQSNSRYNQSQNRFQNNRQVQPQRGYGGSGGGSGSSSSGGYNSGQNQSYQNYPQTWDNNQGWSGQSQWGQNQYSGNSGYYQQQNQGYYR